MTQMTDSQIIHEAMGLCWHKECVETMSCSKCEIKLLNINPSYTSPISYLEAMAWAKKQKWWGDFAYIKNGYDGYDFNEDLLDPKLGSHALASYLEGREG